MKTKLLTLFLITITSYLTAQIVNIPDPAFKSYLLYNFDTNNDHEIQVTEAQAATGGIYVPGDPFVWGEITDLTGIEAFVNITDLQCQLNLIDQPVDLSQNLALMRVKCFDNSIPSLSLGANTVLTELDCSNNNLGSLDVSQNTGLDELKCTHNNLSSLDVSQNIVLKKLYCADNNILGLNIINNIELTALNCSNNNLTDIDLTQNTNLIYFGSGYNQISYLDVSQNTNLEIFGIGYSLITSLDLTQNTNLKILGCNNNSLLETIDVRNGNNINITYFKAENNPNLTCIFVDDVNYSNENWLSDTTSHFLFDPQTHFVETQEECDALKTDDILSLQEISIFPNPSKGVFTLNLNTVTPNTNYQISIHNMIGERLFKSQIPNLKSQISNPKSIIDITHLPEGIYFLTIKTTNKQTLTHKIIKL